MGGWYVFPAKMGSLPGMVVKLGGSVRGVVHIGMGVVSSMDGWVVHLPGEDGIGDSLPEDGGMGVKLGGESRV